MLCHNCTNFFRYGSSEVQHTHSSTHQEHHNLECEVNIDDIPGHEEWEEDIFMGLDEVSDNAILCTDTSRVNQAKVVSGLEQLSDGSHSWLLQPYIIVKVCQVLCMC